ncbi:MAG: hypothetical protein ACRELY_08285 [Polyangiaceae bacterium]
MRAKIILSSFVVVVVALAGGCKTKVDPGAFEGGAAATPSVEATAAATDTADAEADASSDLAPLQTGAAHSLSPAAAGGSHATTKPATDPPECVQARSPACVGNGRTVLLHPSKACQDAKFACFNKGGHL